MRWWLASLVLVAALHSVHANDLVDFDTEIIPILTRHGCNAGSCHGAAIGRGGFKLSLLGSDAGKDYDAIVHQRRGRRVNLSMSGKSLLLQKPSEQLEHEGGMKLDPDSHHFAKIEKWIQQGARRLEIRKLLEVVVSPNQIVLQHGGSFRLGVTAHFDDRTTSDVLSSTVLRADDPEAVNIDRSSGEIQVSRRGIQIVIARLLDRTIPIRITVPLNDQLQQEAARPEANEIDAIVNRQLDQLRLPHSPPAANSELLRRVTVDLAGRLPTLDEYRNFEAHPTYKAIVDRLLTSDDYAGYWALKWANVLSIDAKQLQPDGAKAFHRWLAAQVRNDAPVTDMARAMLTSLGDSYEVGPANFLRTGSSPGDLAEHASRVFMGARLRCANCHDHPLDQWTQDDYHGLAAVFAKVKRGQIVSVSKRGEVTHPVSGDAAIPRIPGHRYLEPDSDGRNNFAQWLTRWDNPYLARVTVNRVWQQLMGRGLVEPVDDLRATNPATNPELLDWLARDFVQNGFRLKHTIRTICLSAAYRRSSQSVPGNEADGKFFSHALTRPLEAEVIADAIADLTGVPIQHGDKKGVRAVSLTNNRAPSAVLDVLGRCDRATACTTNAVSSASLARTLHLINGPLINDRLTDPNGRLAKLLAEESDDEKVLDTLHLITLGRKADNRVYWQARLREASVPDPDQRTEFFQDLFWGLLTSETFFTNH